MLTAAQVDVVVFDKTGTLTADTQSLSRIVSYTAIPGKDYDKDDGHNQTSLSSHSVVLAGCHSLVQLHHEGSPKWIGDPLDLAAFKYSQWSYNETLDCYQGPLVDSADDETMRNGKLWQIKTFPFDPNRRVSTALVLVQLPNGERGFYKVIKGSPDTLQSRLNLANVSVHEDEWYGSMLFQLDSEGSRTIAMGMKEVTSDHALFHILVPNGLANESVCPVPALLDEVVRPARSLAASLSRSQLENSTFECAGFACFDAAIRPSTRRVLQSLRRGGVHVAMLTGDAMEAAILVAATAGLLDTKMSVVVLETASSNQLEYRTLRLTPPSRKHPKPRLELKANSKRLTPQRLKKLLTKHKSGNLTLAATGNAIELAMRYKDRSLFGLLAGNLDLISVVARASPKQKQSLVQSLRDRSGKVVLMCGTRLRYFAHACLPG
jgi:magnesium-transporting ATPase (P-type)